MRAAFVLFVALMTVACAHAPATPLVPTGVDEYDVYQVVLRSELRETRTTVLLLSETNAGSEERPGSPEYEEAKRIQEMVNETPPGSTNTDPSHEKWMDKDFLSAYRSAVSLPVQRLDPGLLSLPTNVQLVEKINGPRWATGYVVVELSRVGFDADHQRAVIFVSVSCGVLCGDHQIVELRREGQRWSIVRRMLTLIS